MKSSLTLLFVGFGLLSSLPSNAQDGGEWSGYVALESRLFPRSPLLAEQYSLGNLSFAVQPEFYHRWANGKQSLTFVPFLRLDQHDKERTHFDIRELYWEKASAAWELKIGVRKVFWGVTESRHLVDIINQTDLVENPDGEDKLGQPMVSFAWIRHWGTLEFFLLPGFRERTFPGHEARLRLPRRVDTDRTEYESGAKNRHVDWAVRWFHTIGNIDLGVVHFYGTSREPQLLPSLDASENLVLFPRYDLINQTSLDLQFVVGSWLWKLEAITRGGQRQRFAAAVGGFEYTFANFRNSGVDIGLLAEYLYDGRNEAAPRTSFDHDIFLGTRLPLNDEQSTDVLAGAMIDLNSGATNFRIESSRRIKNAWKVNLKIGAFANLSSNDLLYSLRRDSYLQLDLARYF